MFFKDDSFNDTSEIDYYGMYKQYWLYGERNPSFDSFSGKILDVKDNYDNGINYFYEQLETDLLEDIVLCYVPSHDPTKIRTGVRAIAEMLTSNGKRIDGTSCLVRHTKIPKLAHGGSRDIHVHLESIEVRDRNLVYNRNVVLLDDVTTSGNSLFACQKLLIKFGGANNVKCVALGKTEGY